mgnify:CR=1 FL=1
MRAFRIELSLCSAEPKLNIDLGYVTAEREHHECCHHMAVEQLLTSYGCLVVEGVEGKATAPTTSPLPYTGRRFAKPNQTKHDGLKKVKNDEMGHKNSGSGMFSAIFAFNSSSPMQLMIRKIMQTKKVKTNKGSLMVSIKPDP